MTIFMRQWFRTENEKKIGVFWINKISYIDNKDYRVQEQPERQKGTKTPIQNQIEGRNINTTDIPTERLDL